MVNIMDMTDMADMADMMEIATMKVWFSSVVKLTAGHTLQVIKEFMLRISGLLSCV